MVNRLGTTHLSGLRPFDPQAVWERCYGPLDMERWRGLHRRPSVAPVARRQALAGCSAPLRPSG